MIHRRGDGRADRGAVVSDADVDTLEILQEPIVVQSERTHDIGGRCECDETDAVIGALVDEPGYDRLPHRNAVDAVVVDREIYLLHRPRDAKSENDVYSIGRAFSATVGPLRPGQADDHERRCDNRQQPNYPTNPTP